MSKVRRDMHFRIKSLTSFEVGSMVTYTSLRIHHFVNNTVACVVAYKTATRRGTEEGEVFIPERYKDMMLCSMPGIFIYRGIKKNRKTGGHPYHDLNVLRPKTLAEVYKTCSESDSGCFSDFDTVDAGLLQAG